GQPGQAFLLVAVEIAEADRLARAGKREGELAPLAIGRNFQVFEVDRLVVRLAAGRIRAAHLQIDLIAEGNLAQPSSMIEIASLSAVSVRVSPATSITLAVGTAAEMTVSVRLSIPLRVSSAAPVWMSVSVPMLPCFKTEIST